MLMSDLQVFERIMLIQHFILEIPQRKLPGAEFKKLRRHEEMRQNIDLDLIKLCAYGRIG